MESKEATYAPGCTPDQIRIALENRLRQEQEEHRKTEHDLHSQIDKLRSQVEGLREMVAGFRQTAELKQEVTILSVPYYLKGGICQICGGPAVYFAALSRAKVLSPLCIAENLHLDEGR